MDSKTTDLFFELLRAGIWARPADLDGICPDDAQWAAILQAGREQTVTGILFDGISTLPAEQMPPRELKFKLAAEVAAIERKNQMLSHALRDAAEILDANGLTYMLLKGMAAGELYPMPQHRSCGDIDLWLPTADCEKATPLLFEGSMVKKDRRHISGPFRGIHIENHYELSHNRMQRYENFGHELLSDAVRLPLKQITVEGYPVVCPSPTFHALFMFEHLAFHLLNGIGLRQLCDLALWLDHYAAEIDRPTVARILHKYGFERIVNALEIIFIDRLQMPEKCAPLPPVRNRRAMRDADFVIKQVLEGGNFGRHHTSRYSAKAIDKLPSVIRKPMRLFAHFQEYPKYRIISRKLFWNRLLFMFQTRLQPNFKEAETFWQQ